MSLAMKRHFMKKKCMRTFYVFTLQDKVWDRMQLYYDDVYSPPESIILTIRKPFGLDRASRSKPSEGRMKDSGDIALEDVHS